MTKPKRIFLSADHGLAVIYFLQSDVVPTLVRSGVEVVVLTDDGLRDQMLARFGGPGISVEGLRLGAAREYAQVHRDVQWWLTFLRRVGGSNRINTAAMDSYIRQTFTEEPPRRLALMPLAWLAICRAAPFGSHPAGTRPHSGALQPWTVC